MSKDTGGPAFPSKQRIYRAGYATSEFEPVSGMTLRDYFAAKAMQSILDQKDVHDGRECENAAWMSYRMADAMLAERVK